MGADLYITSLYERQRQQWEPQFEEAAKRRDSLERGSEEYRKAQAKVEECHEKMNECGYFRDPYNDWDLLWKFGLSWWEDVIPMLDKENRLSASQAEELLVMLRKRENVFELRLATLPAQEREHFHRRYAALQKFLNQAIELDAPIDASL
jgi:chaperonin cofactor prefoldin